MNDNEVVNSTKGNDYLIASDSEMNDNEVFNSTKGNDYLTSSDSEDEGYDSLANSLLTTKLSQDMMHGPLMGRITISHIVNRLADN